MCYLIIQASGCGGVCVCEGEAQEAAWGKGKEGVRAGLGCVCMCSEKDQGREMPSSSGSSILISKNIDLNLMVPALPRQERCPVLRTAIEK